MTEFLAIPAWDASPRPLADWVARFEELGHPSQVSRDAPDEVWLEVAGLRLRGFVVLEGGLASAINFEVHDPDPVSAAAVLEQAASTLGWEIHPDEPEEDDLDED